MCVRPFISVWLLLGLPGRDLQKSFLHNWKVFFLLLTYCWVRFFGSEQCLFGSHHPCVCGGWLRSKTLSERVWLASSPAAVETFCEATKEVLSPSVAPGRPTRLRSVTVLTHIRSSARGKGRQVAYVITHAVCLCPHERTSQWRCPRHRCHTPGKVSTFTPWQGLTFESTRLSGAGGES